MNCLEKFLKKKNKFFLVRIKVFFVDSCNGILIENSSMLLINFLDDDSDFEVLSKLLVKRKLVVDLLNKKKFVKIISFDDFDESIKCLEVFVDEIGLYYQQECVYLFGQLLLWNGE